MNTPKTDAQQGGETPTPRTDEAMRATQGLFRAAAHSNGFVHFARQLERENAYLQSQLDSLRGELQGARQGLPKRPEKGKLLVEVMYSHGDWTEPHQFVHRYELNVGLMSLTRDMVWEFCSTLGADFHDRLSAAFFLVSSSEQRRREFSHGVERSEAKAIITTHQEASSLRSQLADAQKEVGELRECLANCEAWISSFVDEMEPVGGPDDPCAVNLGNAYRTQARALLSKRLGLQ